MDSRRFWLKKEKQYAARECVGNSFIDENLRGLLVDWMYDVVVHLKLNRETFFFSVSMMDRFLLLESSKRSVKELRVVGTVCLWINAELYETDNNFEIKDLLEVCGNTITPKEVNAMCLEIISTLDGIIYGNPSVQTFARHHSSTALVDDTFVFKRKAKSDEELIDICASAFLECAALGSSFTSFFPSSTIASACYSLAKEYVSSSSFSHSVPSSFEDNNEENDEKKCKTAISKGIFENIDESKRNPFLNNVFKRYPFLKEVKNVETDDLNKEGVEKEGEETPKSGNISTSAEKSPVSPSNLPPKTKLISGKKFENVYKTLKKIGSGSYGGVYECESKSIAGLKVAVKQFYDSAFESSGLREIGLLAAINHPNVVSAIEIFIETKHFGASVKVVMPLLPAGDLAHYVELNKNGRYTRTDVKRIMRDICKGLAYLHKERIMHRDLKPGNVVIDQNASKAMLIDLSISRIASERRITEGEKEEERKERKVEGGEEEKRGYYSEFVCTLPYRSPELLLGNKNYDGFALDLWSLGCIMAELVLCKHLFGRMFEKWCEYSQIIQILMFLGFPEENCGYRTLPHWNEDFPKFKRFANQNEKHQHILQYLGEEGYKLLMSLLQYDPNCRLSAKDAVKHAFFQEKECDSIKILPFNEE